jgi:PPK2 family polyphosphate:nucleotide phosphotransferase
MSYAHVVDGSTPFRLADVDPADHGDLREASATRRLESLTEELRELQDLLFAAETEGALVILQGMDAAGKDATIRNVFAAASPEAIRVKHFTEMTEEERAHDFLWRAHQAAPKRGELVIFDRSYYEQLILPQVLDEDDDSADDDPGVAAAAADPALLRSRFEDVRAFESILRNGRIVVVKVFLHVSAQEQERRLRERMDDPTLTWKISANDWRARRSWDRYMDAYEATVNATATPDAPWAVIPADLQWFHNLAVAELLVERLTHYREAWLAARQRIGEEKHDEARQEMAEGEGEEADSTD